MAAAIPMTALDDGEMTLCQVDGRELLICQVQGQYYALDSRCSHAGQPLITGRLDGYQLYCPLHRASFDVRTGQALAQPATEAIDTYPVTLGAGKVHVEIS
jgi:nitrite reductase/ring-hydroxylating ferredoxin subunit